MNQIILAQQTFKIEQMNQKQFFQLADVLCKMVSIQKTPDPQAMTIIIDGLKRNFKKYGYKEFQLAFQMYIDGKICTNLQHFGVLDFMFIRKIMNQYKERRGKAIIDNRQSNQLSIDGPKAPTAEEVFHQMTDHYKKTKTFQAGSNYIAAFEHAHKAQLFTISKEEGESFKKKQITRLKSELNKARKAQQKIRISMFTSILSNENAVKVECKVEYIKEFIKTNY